MIFIKNFIHILISAVDKDKHFSWNKNSFCQCNDGDPVFTGLHFTFMIVCNAYTSRLS